MAQTPHMALELLEQSQAQKEVTVNEALFKLDAILNSGALDRGVNTPPASPAEGDVYIVGASPTGLWAGKAQHVAYFHQIWRFIVPNAGLLLWVIDENAHYVYNGSGWIPAVTGGSSGGGGGSGDMLKATYDGANINQQLVGISATQTLTNKTLNGSNNTISNINLASAVTGTLPVARGGTGLATPGTAGNVLTSNGTSWVSQAPSGSGGGGSSGSALAGFRNLIINGDFRISHRAFTNVANDVYHADRWYALNQSGNAAVSQVADAEHGQLQNIALTQPDVSAKRIGMAQIVEAQNCKHARDKAVCLSARIHSSAAQPIRYAILEWMGTADVVISDVVNDWASTSYTAGGFFLGSNIGVVATGSITPAANTWTPVTVSGTASAAMNNLIVMFWAQEPLAQSATLEIGLVQLELASSKTEFEYRPLPIELALCRRYLPVGIQGAGPGTFYQTMTSNTALGLINFVVPARVAPTGIAISATGDFRITNVSGVGLIVTNLTFNSASVNGARVDATVSAGFAAGSPALLYGNNANARMLFNGAEL